MPTVAPATPKHRPTPTESPTSRGADQRTIRHRRPSVQQVQSYRGAQRGGRVYVPHMAGWYARIPGWHSRSRWLSIVGRWAGSRAGRRACQKHHVEPDTVVGVAQVLARYADHDTGRQVAPSQERVGQEAGCSRKTVQRVENALAAGSLLNLVHGSQYYTHAMHRQYAQLRKRRSGLVKPLWCTRVRALTFPRQAVADWPPVSYDPLPAEGQVSPKPSVPAHSPSDAHARRRPAPRPKNPAPTTGPRPLSLQLLAAGLAQRLPWLVRDHHIGKVCDALSWAQIQPSRWTATTLLAKLATYLPIPTGTQSRSPIGWLHAALQRIDPDVPTPVELERRSSGRLRAEQQQAAEQAAVEQAAAVPLSASTAAGAIRHELDRLRRTSRRRHELPIFDPDSPRAWRRRT